jgi:hypothetical protein
MEVYMRKPVAMHDHVDASEICPKQRGIVISPSLGIHSNPIDIHICIYCINIYIQIPTNGWMTIPQYWKSTLVLTTAYMYFESTETVTGV